MSVIKTMTAKGPNKLVNSRGEKIRIYPYVFIAPFFIAYFVFSFYPALYALRLGFFRWDGQTDKVFLGLQNFIDVIKDEYFRKSLWNTVLFFIASAPETTFLALIVAFLVNNLKLRGRSFFRTVMFLPNITTPIAVGILFTYIFDWNYGVINILLTKLGLITENINFLGEPGLTWFNIAVMVIWRWFGFHMVILLAALQTIDTQLYEAATVDGATMWHSFWHITLPLVKPTVIFLLITSIIGGLNIFDEPMIIYGPGGGPSFSASTLSIYMYSTVFVNNNWGYGSAISFVIFLIVLFCSLTFYKLAGKSNQE